MNTNHAKKKIAAVFLPAALFLGLVAPAFATSVDTGVRAENREGKTGIKAEARLSVTDSKLREKASEEIAKRVKDLGAVSARVNSMTHVSEGVKASITASIQADIAALINLKAKIDADSTISELKADVASITHSYRVYMLVLPQARILAAADRATTIGDMMTAVNAKFQTRVNEARAAGKDVTVIVNAQSDMSTKLADLKLQTNAAITAVSALTPDNGDTAKAEANAAVLKHARANLRVAESDLRAAQKDLKIIIKALKAFDGEAKADVSTKTR